MKNATDDDWKVFRRCQFDRGVPKGPAFIQIFFDAAQ